MKLNNTITFPLAISMLLAVTLGCKQITERFQGRSAVDPTGSNLDVSKPRIGEAALPDADESLNRKATLYIGKCLNPFSNRVIDSYSRYASWIQDLKAGPTGRELIVYGLYDISGDPTECSKAVTEASQLEPELDAIESVAARYAEALTEVIREVKGIHAYYEQDDYKDDNFTKAKSSHPALLAAFENFEAVNKDFSAEVDKLEDQVAQNALKTYETDPSKKFEYAITKFAISSKRLSSYSGRTDFAGLNADTIQELVTKAEADLGDVKSFAGERPLASVYFSAADEFVKASKDLMRRVRDKKPFSSFESSQLGTFSGWMVDGSPDKVRYNYNRLIQSRSMLR